MFTDVCITDIEGKFESFPPIRYFTLEDLNLKPDDINWVDEPQSLGTAITHIVKCQEIGLDCEWKPSNKKENRNKVCVSPIKELTFGFAFPLTLILFY